MNWQKLISRLPIAFGIILAFSTVWAQSTGINGGGPNGGGGGGGSGTVTSVNTTVPAPLTATGCAITTTGTCAITWTAAQTANMVLASPSGTTGAVSLRSLTLADLTPTGGNAGQVLTSGGTGVAPSWTSGAITGSFTGTLTGITTTVTGTINYIIAGGVVTLSAPANILGTSNAAATTITGLVAAVTPTGSRTALCPQLEDASNGGVIGVCIVSNTGAITLNLMTTATAPYVKATSSFQTSLNKGIQTGWQMTYPL